MEQGESGRLAHRSAASSIRIGTIDEKKAGKPFFFGCYVCVPASVMMTGGDLKKVRRRYADEEAAKRRETTKKKREEKRMVDPLKIVQRDRKLIKSVIATWNDKKDVASTQISRMEELLKLIDKAFEYIKTLAKEKLEELREPLNWRNYEELRYVFAMNELF